MALTWGLPEIPLPPFFKGGVGGFPRLVAKSLNSFYIPDFSGESHKQIITHFSNQAQ